MATKGATDVLGLSNVRDIVKWVLIALAIILLIIAGIKIKQYFKNKADKKTLETSAETTVGGIKVNINLGTVAQAIYDAFHNYYGGMSEDEERAIAEVLNVPKALMPQLSDVYYKLSGGKILKAEFIKYLDAEEFNRVRTQFS